MPPPLIAVTRGDTFESSSGDNLMLDGLGVTRGLKYLVAVV
jgi:hypothetical protein